jgi:hypothetical protein
MFGFCPERSGEAIDAWAFRGFLAGETSDLFAGPNAATKCRKPANTVHPVLWGMAVDERSWFSWAREECLLKVLSCRFSCETFAPLSEI